MEKRKEFLNLNFYLLGVFCCLYGLRIKNITLSIFPIIIISMFSSYEIIKKRKIYFNFLSLYYFLFIPSIFVGIFYSKKIVLLNILSFSFFRIILFVSILSFYFIKFSNINFFIKGLKLGILINYFWGTMEYLLWKIYFFPLNDFIFYKKLNIDVGHTWLNLRNGNIRICGISWDPLTIGMLSVLGFILYKNKILKIYSIFILFLSGSRAGMLAIVLTYICYYFFIFFKKYKKIGLILTIFMICVSIFSVSYFKNINFTENGNNRRKEYYFSAIASTYTNNNIGLFLFGGSPFYSGNILAENKEIGKKSLLEGDMWKKNWKIESDWASILVGRGWCGIISYFILLFICAYFIKDKLLKKILLMFFFLGIGNNYESSLLLNTFLICIYQNYNLINKKSYYIK